MPSGRPHQVASRPMNSSLLGCANGSICRSPQLRIRVQDGYEAVHRAGGATGPSSGRILDRQARITSRPSSSLPVHQIFLPGGLYLANGIIDPAHPHRGRRHRGRGVRPRLGHSGTGRTPRSPLRQRRHRRSGPLDIPCTGCCARSPPPPGSLRARISPGSSRGMGR